jgi:hypothetical protein
VRTNECNYYEVKGRQRWSNTNIDELSEGEDGMRLNE